MMQGMALGDQDRGGKLRISLDQLLVAQDEGDADECQDNYVRRMSGAILLASGEPEIEVKIGELRNTSRPLMVYLSRPMMLPSGTSIARASS